MSGAMPPLPQDAFMATNIVHMKQRTREISSEWIMQFELQVANEKLGICIDDDTSSKFDSFLRTFLNIFEVSFPVKYKSIHRNKDVWITQGIKISCGRKRRLYMYSRDSNDAIIKAFYIKCGKILNIVIQQAERQHFNRLIAKSDYKIKTTWNVIKQQTRKMPVTEQMPFLLINVEKIKYPEKFAYVLNSSFLSFSC
jgi:hypothetical protein